MSRLKINLDAIERDGASATEGFCADGVRIGSLLVSSEGVRDNQGNSCVLSLSDLEVVPETAGGFLGKGSSGSVRRAVHRGSKKMVAVKEIKVTGQTHINEIRRELETLHAGDFATPYLVSFYGAFAHEGSVFIAMEAMDGSLHELYKPVPPPVLASITRLMLKGLTYLHRTRHLIHRDLKPSNVLYNSRTGDIKISDFGVSSNLECTKADAHSFVGTVTYMSPERLRGEHYSYGADIWSLGLVVAELAVGVCPYAGLRGGSSEARFWALLQHLNGDGAALELPPEMDSDLADFISACVVKSPDRRPTCTELLRHPFIVRHTAAVPEAEARPFAPTTPTVHAPGELFSPLNSASPAARSAVPRASEGSTLRATSPSPLERHDGETDADVADRTVVARWIHAVMVREVLHGARGHGRKDLHQEPLAAVSASTATDSGEGGGAAAVSAVSLEDVQVAQLREFRAERNLDQQSGDGGSAPVEQDCTAGVRSLTCEDLRWTSTGEPSVNLDDELNRLLF
ncbi:putative mitogen-activated protein kinase kinase 5 [Leishmania major strain Friedlin]|uniref:mitogen-activated protein kinase kinase n=1 Tax=Leishmania major TaxID=5664 RepID=Q4Q1Z0_LEIMA|nr:putative mitogen-activated protein kinase kinase 5 [Leishmania major strain Friedlin]CAG9583604.1 mitogen-activated_protein_kinase_kinase_-_putative [Leishmania major strain Friedlin]CAJ09039.1 putative mitogen-activated protein kinase kinase 5 [Leishmania major strain Friedlin]|eukprot:XP_001686658.1 putative mitogen-activated protein kinase kinase 5 [Leishmania major strain Friedlin]